jgi:fluoroquinolone transport system permease protein
VRAWAALARKDARVVYRDGFLLVLCLVPLLVAAILRALLSWLVIPIPLDDAALYVAPLVVLLPPLLFGTVLGFALIEEREQGTWLLLRVLPLSQRQFLLYLVGTTTALSSMSSLVSALVYGTAVAHVGLFVAMVLSSSLTGPATMLALGSFASNQVEGLAVSKVMSALAVAPAVAFFLAPPWQLAFSWCPWYWLYLGLSKSFAGDPSRMTRILWPGFPDWTLVVVPAALSLAAAAGLARRYRRLE